MANPAKRHHYLPQFYQQRFAGADGRVCLFDRETKQFRRQHPVNTALENDFYTVTNAEGRKSDSLERALADLENAASGVIDRLDSRMNGWRDENELFAFTMFIAFFYTRTPIFDKEQRALGEYLFRTTTKANHSSPEVTAEWLKQFEADTGESAEGISPEKYWQMIQGDEYEVDIPREYNIRLMLDATEHVAQLLLTRNWHFVRAPRDFEFITSDGPFVISPPAGYERDWRAYGALTPGAAIQVPLSPSTSLIIQGEGNDILYGRINKDTARKINANVAQNSDRFTIGRNEAYVRKLVQRTRVDQYRWTSRFEFQTGDIDGDVVFHAKRSWAQKAEFERILE
jgi:hypothetical protein